MTPTLLVSCASESGLASPFAALLRGLSRGLSRGLGGLRLLAVLARGAGRTRLTHGLGAGRVAILQPTERSRNAAVTVAAYGGALG